MAILTERIDLINGESAVDGQVIEDTVDTALEAYRVSKDVEARANAGEFDGKDASSIKEIKFVSSDGNIDTYEIVLNDTTSSYFVVRNGTSIKEIVLKESVLNVDTYSVILTDGSSHDFYVKNGSGISNIEKIAENGLEKTYRINMENGTHFDFVVKDGEKGERGDPFEIAKTYTSVAEMNAGFSTDGVPLNKFVLIENGNVNDPENARLYIKKNTGYAYLTDLSGSQGIKGETGVGVSKVEKTSTSGLVDTYTITLTNGNTSTFTVTNGKNGVDASSIASIQKVGENGLVDTYRINLTNGSSFDFTVTNGADGANGVDGKDGVDGKNGTNGVSITSITVTAV